MGKNSFYYFIVLNRAKSETAIFFEIATKA
jgi:hypothetical protein